MATTSRMHTLSALLPVAHPHRSTPTLIWHRTVGLTLHCLQLRRSSASDSVTSICSSARPLSARASRSTSQCTFWCFRVNAMADAGCRCVRVGQGARPSSVFVKVLSFKDQVDSSRRRATAAVASTLEKACNPTRPAARPLFVSLARSLTVIALLCIKRSQGMQATHSPTTTTHTRFQLSFKSSVSQSNSCFATFRLLAPIRSLAMVPVNPRHQRKVRQPGLFGVCHVPTTSEHLLCHGS
jgi:hypothetical protein